MSLSSQGVDTCGMSARLGAALAGALALFAPGCLPVAPPPMLSPINTAAVHLSEKPSMVLSQRVGMTDNPYFLTQAGRTFGERWAGEANIGFVKGVYDESQRRAPENVSGGQRKQAQGVLGWLAAGRAGGTYEIWGPFKVQGGISYGQGDHGLHYMSADASLALAGYVTPRFWATYGFGFYYTHLINAGQPTYISDAGSYSNYKAYERRSEPGFMGGAGAGYWAGEHVGFSGELLVAANLPMSGDPNDETWPVMAISLGLHIRFDPR